MTQAQYSTLFSLVEGDPAHRALTIDFLMKSDLGRADGPEFPRTPEDLLMAAVAEAEEKAMWAQTQADKRRGW